MLRSSAQGRQFVHLLFGFRLFLIGLFWAGTLGANPTVFEVPQLPVQPEPLRLVLIVLDGIRTEEFFNGTDPDLASWQGIPQASREDLMPFLWLEVAPRSAVNLGNIHARQRACLVNNRQRISLPSYADLLSGQRQGDVVSNRFKGPLRNDTIIDRLLQVQLDPAEVALFASWKHIRKIASRSAPAYHLETGPVAGGKQVPWADARADADLFASIRSFLAGPHIPLRFLFIAFNDADEWAHLNNYGGYLQALQDQDGYIREIYNILESNLAYQGNTVYIITTDHGRGRGRFWMHHGNYPGSQFIWTLVDAPPVAALDPAIRGYWLDRLAQRCSHAEIGQMAYSLLQHGTPEMDLSGRNELREHNRQRLEERLRALRKPAPVVRARADVLLHSDHMP